MAFFFALIFSLATAWSATLMKSPAHGETVDLSDKTLTFTWKKVRGVENYDLLLYFQGPTKPTKTIRVKGSSYTLRFKKSPDRFYWKVNPEGKNFDELFEVVSFQRPSTIIRASIAQNSSRVKLSSDSINDSDSLSGPMIDASIEHFPKFAKNWSLVLNMRKSDLTKGKSSLNEQKVGVELGRVLSSNSVSFHQLYVGYLLQNELNFKFEDAKADYKVNFLSFRYLYSRHISRKWVAELQTSVLLPFPYTFRPSLVVRPAIGYLLTNQWRLDAFIGAENFVSRPNDTGSEKNVDIYQRNLYAGLGFVFGF